MKSFVKTLCLSTVAIIGLSTAPATVQADTIAEAGLWDKDRFQLRLRTVGVLAQSGGHTSIGGDPEADNHVVPEFDITYRMTEHWALELILATTQHDLTLKNRPAGAADLDLGDTMLLPPTLTLQYHFQPKEQFSPYIGAGINYTLPYAEDEGPGLTGLEADGSFGYALQAGADYWINDNWGLNIDIKKVWVDVDVNVNQGAISGELDIDPIIVGAGISYRF